MQESEGWLIEVRREWDGWRTTHIRLADLEDIHWHRPASAPRALIHGYVSCARLGRGELAHECADPAHRLLVCVLKAHTAGPIYQELMRRAGQAPLHEVWAVGEVSR